MNGRRERSVAICEWNVKCLGFFSSRVTWDCLNALGKVPVRRDVSMMCVSAGKCVGEEKSGMFWRECVCQMGCWYCCGNPLQCGLQQRKMKAKSIFSLLPWVDSQELEGAAHAGLEERGHILYRQEVKVEHKVSVAVFTSRSKKWVCERREDDTTEERWEGERERRFLLKVAGRGVGGSEVARCRLNVMK